MEPTAYQQKMQEEIATEQQRIIDDKANSFLSTVSLQEIKIFASGNNAPSKENRYYTTSFVGSQTQYLNFEVNLQHRKPDTRVDFTFYFTIYKDNVKFAESSWKSYVLPEWSNSYHNGGWGDTKPNYWKKGNYRVEIRANNRDFGSAYFTITGKSYPTQPQSENVTSSNISLVSTEYRLADGSCNGLVRD